MLDVNDYTEEKQCNYKEEQYSARDSGVVMRHPVPGRKPGKMDDRWTL